MRQIEFQTSVVGDVKRLVTDVGNELVARDVFAADELVHFFQGGTDHLCFHRHMFGTECIGRVSVVQALGLFEVGFGEPPTHSPDLRLDNEEHVRVGDQVQFDFGHFQGRLKGQAGEGGEVKAVEAVRSQHCLSKSLETVGQKKNVRRHVKVVVFFERCHFASRPYVLVSTVPV